MTTKTERSQQEHRLYRAVWRWHFYAGLFCIPLVIWLSCTGSIYLFKPQIERWLDRPYDHLLLTATPSTPEKIAMAAVRAVPESSLHYYELPPNKESAVRVIVGVGKREYRVYVHPETLAILKVVDEDKRPMRILFYLHGELLAGRWGSYLVELAASWAVVLLVSGLYLWWPQQTNHLAGILWIRLGDGKRIFWRDLHAVTGIWISACALFLILTGLPWASGWGSYFKTVRTVTGASVARQDWTTGSAAEQNQRAALNQNSLNTMEDMPGMDHSSHASHAWHHMTSPNAYAPFNRLVPLAESLHLAAPVEVLPAIMPNGTWTIKSDAQNRTQRDVIQVAADSGRIVSRQNFNQRLLLDRIVGTGVAAHEGQLFGLMNQLLGLATAMGLVLLCISSVVLWWSRRRTGVLGAPQPLVRPQWSMSLIAIVLALLLYLPAMAYSLTAVVLFERFVLTRIVPLRHWLGLVPR